MSKFLIIGVGGAGREAVKHMKDAGIPEAEYMTFGGFEYDKREDIPHYNLISTNEPNNDDPELYEQLAENAEDDIREAIKAQLHKRETE